MVTVNLSRRAFLQRLSLVGIASVGVGCGGKSSDFVGGISPSTDSDSPVSASSSVQLYRRSLLISSLYVPERKLSGRPNHFTVTAQGTLYCLVTLKEDEQFLEATDTQPAYLVRNPSERWNSMSPVSVPYNAQWGTNVISPVTENMYLADIEGNFIVYSALGIELSRTNPWGGFEDGFYASGNSRIAITESGDVLVVPHKTERPTSENGYMSSKNLNRFLYRFNSNGVLQTTTDIFDIVSLAYNSHMATRSGEIFFYNAKHSNDVVNEELLVTDLSGVLKRRIPLNDTHQTNQEIGVINSLDVDLEGNIYVTRRVYTNYSSDENAVGDIRKFSPAGDLLSTLQRNAYSFQCDPVSDSRFYIASLDGIERYDLL